jgi:hypothetical protein
MDTSDHTLAVKSLVLSLLVLFSMFSLSFADTYTGVVSEVKQFPSGGTAVDIDGTYPNQKMVIYIAAGETGVTKMPAVGDKVTANGTVANYKGRPEIKIHSGAQWTW